MLASAEEDHPVLDADGELRHEHEGAAVAHEGDDLAIWMGDRGSDGIGMPACHGREIARDAVHPPSSRRDVPGPPRGDGAAVAGDDGIAPQPQAELAHEHLRLHGASVRLTMRWGRHGRPRDEPPAAPFAE